MQEQDRRRTDRVLKRRFFVFGGWVTGVVLAVALLASLVSLVFGVDARPFVAVLPMVYAVVLIAGVAWLAWTTAAPPPEKR